MKRLLVAGAVLVAMAATARAQIICLPPVKVDAGIKPWFKLYVGDVVRCGGCAYRTWGPNGPPGGCCANGPGGCGNGFSIGTCGGCGGGCCGNFPGPWYLFWPYEANFQVPAPTGYPFYPAPQTLPAGPMPRADANPHQKGSEGSASTQASIQTVAQPRIITDASAVPSYWYHK